MLHQVSHEALLRYEQVDYTALYHAQGIANITEVTGPNPVLASNVF